MNQESSLDQRVLDLEYEKLKNQALILALWAKTDSLCAALFQISNGHIEDTPTKDYLKDAFQKALQIQLHSISNQNPEIVEKIEKILKDSDKLV
ncbi:MAG TPA: hypothetical protein VHG71_10420 [Verrucomicrobiae bacterium]|nr:hypothetical protein [Verrucomicrobiae bacterium]